jgi:hypothetical protein
MKRLELPSDKADNRVSVTCEIYEIRFVYEPILHLLFLLMFNSFLQIWKETNTLKNIILNINSGGDNLLWYIYSYLPAYYLI